MLLYAHEAFRSVYVRTYDDGDMFKHQCNRAIVVGENGIYRIQHVCMLYVCFSGKSASSWSTFCCELKLHWSSGYEKNVCRAVQHFLFSSKINRLNMNVYTKWIQWNWCCISVLSEPIQHSAGKEDDDGGGGKEEEKFNKRAPTTKLLSRLFPLCIENVLKTIDNHIT